ncbi:MAG: glycosyltransferase family 2 protein [Rhodospirillales bacterium]|nr:glycosyltransferase family 2 protein [Rhodospirillales bacterium]MDE2576403.1 glycosyltransferase family 2 protein [Rhodospirillales bacterium]
MAEEQSSIDKKYNRIEDLVRAGEFARAISVAEKMGEDLFDRTEELLSLFVAMEGEKNFSMLEFLSDFIRKKRVTDLRVILSVANAYRSISNVSNAEIHYIYARFLEPTNYWSYYSQSQFKADLGLHEDARIIIEDGLKYCRGKISETEWANLQREYIKLVCLARRDDIRYFKSLRSREFYSGRPVKNALVVLMVKNEDDIIYSCLEAAYRVGLRYFLVADNASSDGTRREIEKFQSSHADVVLLYVHDGIIGYWQDKKMNAFWKFGVDYFKVMGHGIDWVFPIDADEVLVQADPEVDLFEFLNSWRSADAAIAVGMWCTAASAEVMEQLNPAENLDAAFPVVAGYDAAPATKIAFRVGPNVELDMGNHFAFGCIKDSSDVTSLNAFGLFLLHHPFRSRRQLRSKITNGVKALMAASGLPAHYGSHWRRSYENYMSRGEAYIEDELVEFCRRTAELSALLADQGQHASETIPSPHVLSP